MEDRVIQSKFYGEIMRTNAVSARPAAQTQCPFRVMSNHLQRNKPCRLYPRKQTFSDPFERTDEKIMICLRGAWTRR